MFMYAVLISYRQRTVLNLCAKSASGLKDKLSDLVLSCFFFYDLLSVSTPKIGDSVVCSYAFIILGSLGTQFNLPLLLGTVASLALLQLQFPESMCNTEEISSSFHSTCQTALDTAALLKTRQP